MASWFKLNYPKRLFLGLLVYSLVLVGCFVAFQYHREEEFKASEINSQLQLVNGYILNELREGKDLESLDLSELSPFENLRVSLLNSAGEVVYDNTWDTLSLGNHLDREEIKEALATGSGYQVRRHSQSNGETYFYAAKTEGNGMIVRTAVPYSASLVSLLRADYGFLWAMGIVTVIMCLLGYLATRRVGQHIVRLRNFADNAEKGTRISDTEPFPHDELGEISNNIVRLYARLQQALADRDSEHQAALYQQQEKERIKKELTNNINHELRTPVASIQVCLETLAAHPEMDATKREGFVQRGLSNTERLKRLLGDVSLLTRMDDGGDTIGKEELDLGEILNDVVSEHDPIAGVKNIGIDCQLDGRVPIVGNRALLESAFANLIDNAISYSGGSKIQISVENTANTGIRITLSDNGQGIPEEHLPKIFERFYRIDKGRSRAAGGTGLGLAIVKNAVAFHQGTINAKNLKEGGLEFNITLPRVSQ